MTKNFTRLIIATIWLIFNPLNAFCQLSPDDLKCEYKVNPAGIETKTPRFSWIFNSPSKGLNQGAYQLCVADSKKELQSGKANIWDSGKVLSGNNSSVVFTGKAFDAAKKYFWRVRIWDQSGKGSKWSDISEFSTGILSQNTWNSAKWIAYEDLPDSSKVVPGIHLNGDELGPKLLNRCVNPYFRKAILISKPVSEAYAFVSGLGQYELYLNGTKVSDDFLTPGWTDYAKRCLYNSYDVTDQLQRGENSIGCLTGAGFFYINRERYRKFVGAYGYPMMRMILYVRYTDGTTQQIGTDQSWKTSPSPIEYSGIYGGEDYNANKELPGWDKPGYDDSTWENAILAKGPGGFMQAQTEYPLKVMETFKVKTVVSPAQGKYIYDFGQNASGIIELEVQGTKGDTVKIIPGELLDKNGLVSQKSSGGPFYFQYILKGDKAERWTPRFTYYGFRYVMIEGAVPGTETKSTKPRITSLKFLHTRSFSPAAGSFSCSSPFYNQVFNLIDWSIKSNMASVLTDCPHREKMGWLEEVHLMGESINYNYDVFHLYNKVLDDMIDAQADNGMAASTAPEYVHFPGAYQDCPGYGSAIVIVPWYLYKWYGDRQALEKSYDHMARYVAYLGTKAKSNILNYGLGDWLDLGPKKPGLSQLTPISLTATAFYYYDAFLLSKMAGILGHKADTVKYARLSESIKDSFNAKFYNAETKSYGTGSQTSLSMPLYMGIVNKDDYKGVFENLKKSLLLNNKVLTAGDIGHRFLLKSLEQSGESQLIFDMYNRSDVPGYGFQLKKGATALTEHWAALDYLSHNHMILGHLMEWFYTGLAGIRQQEGDTGFKKIIIDPQQAGDISWVKASHLSTNGKINVEWQKDKDRFILKVEIPANSEAEVILPVQNPEDVTVNGYIVKNNVHILKISEKADKLVLTIASGRYEFICKTVLN